MMSEQAIGLTKWHQFVRERDEQVLSEALADNVLFRSPALWKPREGKAMTMLYLKSAVRVLEDFTYLREFVREKAVVLEFSARVGKFGLKGVDIIQFNDQGKIVDFEVMVRPASGLQALIEAMTRELEAATSKADDQ